MPKAGHSPAEIAHRKICSRNQRSRVSPFDQYGQDDLSNLPRYREFIPSCDYANDLLLNSTAPLSTPAAHAVPHCAANRDNVDTWVPPISVVLARYEQLLREERRHKFWVLPELFALRVETVTDSTPVRSQHPAQSVLNQSLDHGTQPPTAPSAITFRRLRGVFVSVLPVMSWPPFSPTASTSQ